MTPDVKLRVGIVDDDDDLRFLVRAMLDLDSRFEVVAEGVDGHQAVRMVVDACPDILILDLRMPELDGTSALRQIRAHDPEEPPRVVVLSADPPDVHEHDLAPLGIRSYLTKSMISQIADEVYAAAGT